MTFYWPLIRKWTKNASRVQDRKSDRNQNPPDKGKWAGVSPLYVQETWNNDYVITIAFATLNMVWVIQRVLHKCFSAAERVNKKQRTALNSAFELGFCDWLDENRNIKRRIWEFTRVWQNQKGGATWRLESQNSDYVGGNN